MVQPKQNRFLVESLVGAPLGVAGLGVDAKVPETQIPAPTDGSGWWTGIVAKLKALFVQKNEHVFNVRDYGAKGDGASDDYAAILAAQNAAGAAVAGGASGGVVYFPPGNYVRASGNDFDFPSGVTWRGAGSGATTITQSHWNGTGLTHTIGPFNTGQASFATLNALTANAVRQTNAVTITSTTGIATGDLLWIGRAAPEGGTATIGEFIRVKSVDSTTQLTIWGHLRETYTTAAGNGIKTTKLFKRNVGVEGITFVNSQPATTSMSMLMFNGCIDVTVRDVVVKGCSYTAIGLKQVYGATVDNVHCYDQADKTGVSDGSQRFGYGVSTFDSAEHVKVTNCSFTRLRHGFTTNGYGARTVIVSNCTATECTASPFDTHPNSFGVEFIGCYAENCTQPGFQLRGIGNKVIGSVVENCSGGVLIMPDARGSVVKGNSFRHLGGVYSPAGSTVAPYTNDATTMGTGWAVQIVGGTDATIDGNLFEHMSRSAIRLATPAEFGASGAATISRVDVLNNKIINPGKSGQYRYAMLVSSAFTAISDIRFTNNLVGAYAAESGEAGTTGAIDNMIYWELPAANVTGRCLVRGNSMFGTASNFHGGNGRTSTNIVERSNLYVDRADFGVNDVEQFGGARFGGDVTIADGKAIITGTNGGLRIGTGATSKLGFYGKVAVVRPALTYSRATETAPDAAIRAALADLGLITDSTTA